MLQSNQKIIRHKVGRLNLAEERGNVSKACQVTSELLHIMAPLSQELEPPPNPARFNTALAMVFKLLLSARKKWRRLDGSNNLAEAVKVVTFTDGIKPIKHAA